jgi:hypothetical protein
MWKQYTPVACGTSDAVTGGTFEYLASFVCSQRVKLSNGTTVSSSESLDVLPSLHRCLLAAWTPPARPPSASSLALLERHSAFEYCRPSCHCRCLRFAWNRCIDRSTDACLQCGCRHSQRGRRLRFRLPWHFWIGTSACSATDARLPSRHRRRLRLDWNRRIDGPLRL